MADKQIQKALSYKDQDPESTVSRVKSILQGIGVVLDEQWVNKGEDGVFSLRTWVPNTMIGTNGKGISEDLARASAYSEFLERLQNLRLSRSPLLWQNEFPFSFYIDEQMLSAEKLVYDGGAFLKVFFEQRKLENATLEEKLLALRAVQGLDYRFSQEKDKFLCFPFFNVSSGSFESLPYYLYSAYYASNGMCAGNSPEEALVQGLSEIIERYVQKKVMQDHLVLPDIADDYIKEHVFIDQTLRRIRETQRYKVFLKDCSLGKNYPVCALMLTELDTGKYGIKFGCHPDFSVAMERTITEAAQGNRLVDYAQRSVLDFRNSHVDDEINILNGYQSGIAQYAYEVLGNGGISSSPPSTVQGKTNRMLLKELINLVEAQGHNVLIRDVSFLGYPSYHVIVPGMSEVLHPSDDWFRALEAKYQVMELLKDPATITGKNCDLVIRVMEYFANTNLENSMSSYYGVLGNVPCPGEEYGLGWLYFIAMCYALKGDFAKAISRMELFIAQANRIASMDKRYLAVRYYFSAMLIFQCHAESIGYLANFFGEAQCTWLDSTFKDITRVLVNQYQPREAIKQSQSYSRYEEIIDNFKRRQLTSGSQTGVISNYLRKVD